MHEPSPASRIALDDELALALALADDADLLTSRWFRSPTLDVTTKADLTPVTQADREVEEAWRRRLVTERPGHSILGEEFGAGDGVPGDDGPVSQWRWVLDPIDGTKNFVRGMPVWASLIGLERDGVPVVGVVSAPALGRRWWARQGGGAWESGRRIEVSRVAEVADAFFSYDSLVDFEDDVVARRWIDFARSCGRTRGLGDFWSHVLVAEGAVDVAAEPDVSHWDMSAVQVIVQEAGGRFSDLSGATRPDGGSALSTNGLLHAAALDALVGGLN